MTVYGLGKGTSTRGNQLSDVELFVFLLFSVSMQFSVLTFNADYKQTKQSCSKPLYR